MIRITDKSNCCGCEACVNACPKNCIEFLFDNEGFGYPQVDTGKCIGCNLCEEICPMNKNEENDDDLLQSFIGKTKNEEILQKCTSGGVFTQTAKMFIHNGGIVYGAAYDLEFIVRHVRCTNEEELIQLSGSKYVQSRMGNVYEQVRNDINSGKKVLFCGTPCQINGVLNFVGSNENLFTIDFACRAVPSPLVWNNYVKYMDKKFSGKIKKYVMRSKIYGYQFSHFVSYDDKGKIIYKGGTFINQYLRAFFSGICNRPSCYKCVFKTLKRNSDITIGDCFFSNEYGVSNFNGACSIIIHTLKGQKIIETADLLIKGVDLKELARKNKELTIRARKDKRREAFFESIANSEIEDVLNQYFPMSFGVYSKYYLRLALKKIGLHDIIKRAVIRFRK